MAKKVKAEKRPARPPASMSEALRAGNATFKKDFIKPITEMDSDEILDTFGHSVAGGEKKKRQKMKVSGKSVFALAKIISKGSKKRPV